AAQRCRSITARLLRFSEQGVVGPRPFALNAVVQDVIDMMSASLSESRIEVTLKLDQKMPDMVGEAGQLGLVLINLIANARNAMPEGGRLLIETHHAEGQMHLIVQDSGTGIKAEHIPRLFEPFFTTKSDWNGAGLGLSVAYR